MAALTADATLAADSLRLAETLGRREWAQDAYLAGSAALALHLGHRPVRELDLMGAALRLTSPERRDLLEDLLSIDPAVKVETARDGYLFVRTGGGVGVRLFYYPYPLVAPEEWVGELAVASLLDLALMKLGAVISRGTRRDFVDLYLVCRHLPLDAVLARSHEKFGHVLDFPLQALKGLVDFSLIEGEPMPLLADETLTWDTVEEWLTTTVRDLATEELTGS